MYDLTNIHMIYYMLSPSRGPVFNLGHAGPEIWGLLHAPDGFFFSARMGLLFGSQT